MRGFEGWCVQESIGARKWERVGLPLSAHRQNSIRLARQRFCKHGGTVNVELLKCMEACPEDVKIVDYSASGQVIQAAKIHTHPLWKMHMFSDCAQPGSQESLAMVKNNNGGSAHLIRPCAC